MGKNWRIRWLDAIELSIGSATQRSPFLNFGIYAGLHYSGNVLIEDARVSWRKFGVEQPPSD
jgi:hypothetical protein